MAKFEPLSYEQVKERLCSIPNTRDRALLKTIYGGCARVGEVVNKRLIPMYKTKTKKNKDKIKIFIDYSKPRDCLMLENLEIKTNALVLRIPTEKNPRAGERRVPISRIADNKQKLFKKSESWLTEDIIDFFKTDPMQNNYGSSIRISTQWAEMKFKKYFPEYNMHIHWLRHWRATHLLQGTATGIPLPIEFIQRIGGWQNSGVVSSTYIHTVVEDYIDLW